VLIINHENEEVRGKVKLRDKIIDLVGKREISLENFTIGPNKVVAFWLKRGYN